jgi:hypothetical protein
MRSCRDAWGETYSRGVEGGDEYAHTSITC